MSELTQHFTAIQVRMCRNTDQRVLLEEEPLWVMSARESVSIQLKPSQVDSSRGNGNNASALVDHDPWPAHAKKHAHPHSTPRKSRRHSVLAQDFDKLAGLEGLDEAASDVHGRSIDLAREHGSGRRRSSVRRGSLIQEQIAEYRTRRRQSLLPVLRAASKGEEVEVIDGIKNSESSLQKEAKSASAQWEKRKSFEALAEGQDIKKERSESLAPVPSEVTSSVSNTRRRSRSSSVKEGVASEVSQELSMSGKLEDQINLQHLVELMRVFNVRMSNTGNIIIL